MKVLVIGQGGREHALVRALRFSPSITEVHILPGSEGMEKDAVRHSLDWRDFDGVDRVLKDHAISLTVIGPEVPLAGGLSDVLRARGHRVFGPSRDAAQLEASKVFSKRFMLEAGIPTARAFEVRSAAETMSSARRFAPPYVLKADGLAAGKGVFICRTEAELAQAARSVFVDRSLGDAGSTALLEDFTPGYEVSCLALTNGQEWEQLIMAADHKRLLDHDLGPNTGGMGTVAPFHLDASIRERIDRDVFAPTMRQLQKMGLLYRGVLYAGLMVTEHGISVIEFNVRFGDPEAQVILPLLDGDWGVVMAEVADGRIPRLKWKSGAAACVVMAAEGYPEQPVKDSRIEGELDFETAGSYFLHAGTARFAGSWVTGGGRVLNAVGVGSDLREALGFAYRQADKAGWLGMQMRRDIGRRVLEAKPPKT